MIITRKWAKSLIAHGQAYALGQTTDGTYWPEGTHYSAIQRTDIDRVDHYLSTDADEPRGER